MWSKNRDLTKDEPAKAEAVIAVNPFLVGLTEHEIENIRDEAWRHYGHNWLSIAKRSRYVRQPLLETLDKHGYARELQMVPVVESSYDPYAVSSVGATGLWQLMPETAADLRIKSNRYFDGRRDIRSSTRGAAKYLTKQYRRFGNWPMALAAYHLGPNAVQRRLNRHPWSPAQGLRALPLPPITKTYIRHTLGLIILHQEAVIAFPDPYKTTTITINTPLNLEELHRKAELPINQIFRFNPELTLEQYFDGRPKKLSLRISQVRLTKVKQALANSAVDHLPIYITKDETVEALSSRYRTSNYTLLKYNPGLPATLKAGSEVRIPVSVVKRLAASKNPMLKDSAIQMIEAPTEVALNQ